MNDDRDRNSIGSIRATGADRLKSVEELHAVHRASSRLQFVLEPEELAHETIRVLEDTLGYEFAAVLLVDEYSQRLFPFALSDQGQGPEFAVSDREKVVAHDIRLGRGITGWVAAHGRSVRSPDVRADPRYLDLRAESGIVSELCVPMRSHGRVIGVVNVETSRPDAYSESDQRVLEIIASQIASAVENSRLQRELVHAQRLDAVGRLASGIAHDFNNLLTVINGYTEIFLTRKDLDGEFREGIVEVRKAGLRAAEMTRKLLAFGRKSVLRPEILDANEQITALKTMLERLVGEDVRLTFKTDPELGPVEVDPTQFGQIIVNLVVNARDAMPAGGSVEISTARENLAPSATSGEHGLAPGQYSAITISDTGHGLSAEVRRSLFEPFFTTKKNGSGLGLAMVHGIVRQSGGNIQVESRPGLGTRFIIYLPEVTRPDPTRTAQRKDHSIPSVTGQVLLIEDEDIVRSVVTVQLESLGFSVLTATNAKEALEIAGRADLELALIVSDIVMPEMDGPEVVRLIRERHPAVKTLYMSGYPARWLDSRGSFMAGEHLLPKPFTRATLKRKLRDVLVDDPADPESPS